MPYVTIPTVSTGMVISAAHLNSLSDNQEYLHGLANQANAPFNSYRKTGNVSSADMKWFGRHRCRYFHYKITCSSPTHVRVFYTGVLVAGDETTPPNTFAGYVDLENFNSLPNYRGTWLTATLYQALAEKNNGDGDVVSSAGIYYRCTSTHTSAAATNPGVGASWATVWQVINEPAIGSIFDCHVDVQDGEETTVEYLIEADSTSL